MPDQTDAPAAHPPIDLDAVPAIPYTEEELAAAAAQLDAEDTRQQVRHLLNAFRGGRLTHEDYLGLNAPLRAVYKKEFGVPLSTGERAAATRRQARTLKAKKAAKASRRTNRR